MDLSGDLKSRIGKDISPKYPGRAYEQLSGLVSFLEEKLPDIEHYYQGGFFIGNYTGEPRYTQDVDMSIVNISTYGRVKEVLLEYGELLVSQGKVSRYVIKPDASERKSGGAKYYAPDGSVLFSIDIGYHERPLTTVAIESNEGSLRISTVEQMLCDKFCAMFSPRRLRRIKDVFDAWHIVTRCKIDEAAFVERLKERNLFPLPILDAPFTDERLPSMENAYNTINIYDVRTGQEYIKPAFDEAVFVLCNFYRNFSDAEV